MNKDTAAPMRVDVTQVTEDEMIEAAGWVHAIANNMPSERGLIYDLAAEFHRLAHTARPDAGDEDFERVERFVSMLWANLPLLVRRNNVVEKSAVDAALAAMREGVDRGMVELPEAARDLLEARRRLGYGVHDRIDLWNCLAANLGESVL